MISEFLPSPQPLQQNNRQQNFSTPEKRESSEEQIQGILQHTPKAKKTPKRNSIPGKYNNSPSNNGNDFDTLNTILEYNKILDDDSNSFKNKPFFQKLNDSQYKPQHCYQLLFSEDENPEQDENYDYDKENIPPVNFYNYNPQIHKESYNQNQKKPLQNNFQMMNHYNIPQQYINNNLDKHDQKQYNHKNTCINNMFTTQIKQFDPLSHFLNYFNEKNNDIMSLFTQNAVIEVVGEEEHSLMETLSAFAQIISKFEFSQSDIEKQEYEGSYVYSVQGTIKGQVLFGEFIMSAMVEITSKQEINKIRVIFKLDQANPQ